MVLLLLVEFCEWFKVGIDAYMPYQRYQVKPHSSLWFSAACAAAIVHRNDFFCFYEKDKSSASKVNFRKASNCCKRIVEAAKVAYVNKSPSWQKMTKESITSQKLRSRDFWEIASSVLNKSKSGLPPLFSRSEVLYKLLKTFLRTLILMSQVTLYLFSLLELGWNCIIYL